MAETFSLFGLNIYAYGLYAAIGAALLLFGMSRVGKEMPQGTVGVFGVLGMVLGIVGLVLGIVAGALLVQPQAAQLRQSTAAAAIARIFFMNKPPKMIVPGLV